MVKRGYKLIICVVLVATLLCSFCTCFASAELPVRSVMQRFNAWVATALIAGNILIGSTLAPIQDVLDSLSYGSGMPWTPSYTYSGPSWDDDILDRAIIQVSPGYTTVDGVPYTDIIISSDASNKFRVNAFDLETAWNIASNSEGTFASGYGYYYDIPLFDIDGNIRSQKFVWSGTSASISPSFSATTVRYGNASDNKLYRNGNQVFSWQSPPAYSDLYFAKHSNDGFIDRVTTSTSGSISRSNSWEGATSSAFEFDWVSGTVPAEELPEGSQLHMLVPDSYTAPSGGDASYNYDLHDLINIYPQFDDPNGYEFNFDPDLNPDFDVDLDASDALGNIISAIIAAYLAGLIDTPSTVIEYTVDEPDPQPGVIDPLPDPDPAPDEPVAGTTIADTDWTKLDELLRWIQSTIDSIRHITESLQTMLNSLFDQLQNIIQTLQTLPQQILEDIETGPSKVFRKALDVLKSLFLPLLLPIKAMMGLWHYVVEWLQSVNAPFVWIFGVMSGTSGNLVLPIYATLAGSICIAIYKALGR